MSRPRIETPGPARLLREGGIANPIRVAKLIRDTILGIKLDLSGLSVVTEAASGPFVVTPVIAAAAGAREVIAITTESPYATTDLVTRQTRALESLCGTKTPVEIHVERKAELFARADIVTNLGFVRPLDEATVNLLRPGSVIALMCEAWEFRDGDVDLAACRRRGVEVYATNEESPALELFAYSAWVAIQLLLEAGIELHKSRVAIVSSDKFGRVIRQRLSSAGVAVTLHDVLDRASAAEADAILVADYTRHDEIIGRNGDLSPDALARANGAVTVVQFAGRVDVEGLQRAGVCVWPGVPLESRRMLRTLATLGPRPVIELHAAGLKVGELALRTRRPGTDDEYAGLMQTLY